jgi:hypothetical protein
MRGFDWLLRLAQRPGRELRAEIAAVRDHVEALPVDAARAEAEELLRDAQKYDVEDWGDRKRPDWITRLPINLRDFFFSYASVKERYGDTVIAVDEYGPSEYAKGLTRIGRGIDHTEVVFRDRTDDVWQIDGSERTEEEMEHFRTVYHLLLFNGLLIYRDNLRDVR